MCEQLHGQLRKELFERRDCLIVMLFERRKLDETGEGPIYDLLAMCYLVGSSP